jgi:hypothetical protein
MAIGGKDKQALYDAIEENSSFELILNEIKKNITQ